MPQNSEKLVSAYNRMMERVKTALDHAEQDTLPTVQHHIDTAKKKAVELGELTREESEKIALYVKRDLHDAAEYMSNTGHELANWLRFDLQQIEQRMLDMFTVMVDRTRLELDELGLRARQASTPKVEWHTGEITAPGILHCSGCAQAMSFPATGRIPPCPKCHATIFHRRSGGAD